MTKTHLTAFLVFACLSTAFVGEARSASEGNWVMHSEELNGDVHFHDASRVERDETTRRVWNRIRYKASVMGAASFQSLLEIDCAERTVRVLQSTFFSDADWQRPAMGTNTTAKPVRRIAKGSAAERLAMMVCD